jgi:hypothetical protein
MSEKKWLQRYVFRELHDIFFGEFLIILTEWLEILVENTERYHTIAPSNLTHDLVRQLKSISNTTSCAFDLWLNSILGGYIKEFIVDCT